MDYTTTTKLSRNAKGEFAKGMKVVLCNNEDIGLIWGKDYYEYFKNSTVLEELRQEIWEAKDKTTRTMVASYNAGEKLSDDAIDFDGFVKKYDV